MKRLRTVFGRCLSYFSCRVSSSEALAFSHALPTTASSNVVFKSTSSSVFPSAALSFPFSNLPSQSTTNRSKSREQRPGADEASRPYSLCTPVLFGNPPPSLSLHGSGLDSQRCSKRGDRTTRGSSHVYASAAIQSDESSVSCRSRNHTGEWRSGHRNSQIIVGISSKHCHIEFADISSTLQPPTRSSRVLPFVRLLPFLFPVTATYLQEKSFASLSAPNYSGVARSIHAAPCCANDLSSTIKTASHCSSYASILPSNNRHFSSPSHSPLSPGPNGFSRFPTLVALASATSSSSSYTSLTFLKRITGMSRGIRSSSSSSFLSSAPLLADKVATSAATVDEGGMKRKEKGFNRRARVRVRGLLGVLGGYPEWGIGQCIAKRTWGEGTYYRVTKVKVSQKTLQAWGVFHQNGVPTTAVEEKIAGSCKPLWKLVVVDETPEGLGTWRTTSD
eukprot:TRINITY_DN26785_c0_g1_i1.p1 TRINITY_DN26785_c0_g1~~TRINITY_DN26785_c0_g1_i1.p1  ORF type:complete len:448 (-),score=34.10 TRINITY_DN26785_c0_g1_i1:212-1555(-)